MLNRTCCSLFFTCKFLYTVPIEVLDVAIDLTAVFHSLSSQHEIYEHASELTDRLLVEFPDLPDFGAEVLGRMRSRQTECVRDALASGRSGGLDCCKAKGEVASVLSLWNTGWDESNQAWFVQGTAPQYRFFHDEPWRWARTSRQIARDIGFNLDRMPWCFPSDDPVCNERMFLDIFGPSSLSAAANKAARLEVNSMFYPDEAFVKKTVHVQVVRDFDHDHTRSTLHVSTLMFERAGHWLLPQFLGFYRERFGQNVSFYLWDHDLGDVSDGRLALAEAYDCAVLLARPAALEAIDPDFWVDGGPAKAFISPRGWNLTSGITPYAWQATWNHFWKRLKGLDTWMLYVDLDEFLDISPAKLELWTFVGVNVVRAVGFNMVGTSRDLREVTRGKRDARFNKLCLFRPDEVDELNRDMGAHTAAPEPAENLAHGTAALYHYKFAAPDPFGDLPSPSNGKPSSVWESIAPTCGRGYEAYVWKHLNDTAVELFGRGNALDGLPVIDWATRPWKNPPRSFDVDAIMAEAHDRCAHDYLPSGGEDSGDTWKWSSADVDGRIHPPYDLVNFSPHEDPYPGWPGYRDNLDHPLPVDWQA